MARPSDEQQQQALAGLLGLGSHSARKSHYPELVARLDELEAERNRYKWLFEHAVHGIFQASLSQGLRAANPALARMLGYDDPQEVLWNLQDMASQLFVGGEAEMRRIRALLRERDGLFGYETRLRRRDGSHVIVLMNLLIKPGEDGLVEGFVADITERVQAQQRLQSLNEELEQRVAERTRELEGLNQQLREARDAAEAANQSKDKYLAAARHDLLQPLNAARLFTSALQERSGEALVRNISQSLEDVETLLGTLVDISKLDAGVIKPDIASFDVSELLGNLAAEYRQVAASEGLALDFVPCGAQVRSDIQLLARILRNLLTNAIRYTPSGRVLLGCRRRRHSLWIEVWDTGVGIAADKLGEIFQEFKRGDVQRFHQDRGLGLGLAIVEKIARMLGHRIHVESVPGKGSRFAIEVPLARRVARSAPEPERTADDLVERLRGSRVWVLDNDASICAGMRTLLETWGCQVVTALSEEDLARQVDNFHAESDLLIVDYHLDDGLNGVDAVASINARRGTPLPALMITANYSNELKQQVRELGHTLMHKPVRPMKLKTALCHLIDNAH